MRRKIPSTAALVAFESAARHQSFTKAADELALTQSAVCRQIAGLEEFLGIELFRRSRRGVKLTEAGLAYSRKVATQLDAVERDTLAAMGQQGAQGLELAVVPTFATQWLVPRLKEFQRLHPEVTVHLTRGHPTAYRAMCRLLRANEFDCATTFLGVDGAVDGERKRARFFATNAGVPVAVVAVAVKLWLPSPRSGVVKFQLPRALAVAVPSGVVPS